MARPSVLTARPPFLLSLSRRSVAKTKRQATNPFYVVLMVVGVIFALTASAYGWSARLKLDPQLFDRNENFIQVMDQYGIPAMVVELGLLTVFTFLAIGTDDFWERRAQTGRDQAKSS